MGLRLKPVSDGNKAEAAPEGFCNMSLEQRDAIRHVRGAEPRPGQTTGPPAWVRNNVAFQATGKQARSLGKSFSAWVLELEGYFRVPTNSYL